MRKAILLGVLSLAAGCAGTQRPAARGCDDAWAHVDATLRAGLDTYVAELDRYLTTTIPGARTDAAQARARSAAERWSAGHREGYLAGCRTASEKERRCVLAAKTPVDLSACGLEPLVKSFTDEVLPAYAERPVDASAETGAGRE